MQLRKNSQWSSVFRKFPGSILTIENNLQTLGTFRDRLNVWIVSRVRVKNSGLVGKFYKLYHS